MREEIIRQIESYLEELKTVSFGKLDGEGKFLSIESYNCHLNNGKEIVREKILKGKKDGSAAIVLAVTDREEYILAIEPRVFTKKTALVDLPAGYIEENESPSYAAERELLEETGYVPENLILLGSFYQDQGCSGAYNHYFLATGCRKIGEQKLDDGEFIKYVLVNYEELVWLLDNGYIKALNSAYAIERAKPLLRRR